VNAHCPTEEEMAYEATLDRVSQEKAALLDALREIHGWAGVGLLCTALGMQVQLEQIRGRALGALDGSIEIMAAADKAKEEEN